jgi:gas vesicle protein
MKSIISFLFGAAVGAVAALFLAPSSGEDLRAQVQEVAERDAQRLQQAWQQDMQKMNDQIVKLQSQIQDYQQQLSEKNDASQDEGEA